ncbi:MAG: endonuclease III [Myxococcota bacterium]
MNKTEKAERIGVILDRLYPDPPIPLDHRDPFTLLVAVVLSAQTTDKKVNEVTPHLFARAGTPKAMAALSVEEIREIIREIGLAPQKAKSLRGLAERLLAEHDSKVPRDFESLVALPGVGRKTANVVLAQAFGVPAFPVDTHIHRLANRWGLSQGETPDAVEADLVKLFPKERWNKVHLQIIYFGREHCPARHHDLAACEICSFAATKAQAAREKAGQGAKRGPQKKRAPRKTS